MTPPKLAPISLQRDLQAEDRSSQRHEYLGGHLHAMTGGSMRHHRIALNIASALTRQPDGSPCLAFINDMKQPIEAADSVYTPDVFVHCGSGSAGPAKLARSAELIVEVLSGSTAGIDRREKRVARQRLPRLRACWIVSQDEQRVEVHERGADGSWRLHECPAGDTPGTAGLTQEGLALASVSAGTDVA